jgi:valyl-tRNA synthetase
VIDPLEIIERFGTDATRFTLAAMAAPGTDIAFNESRTDGYRAFANKIWNAARFMFMNVERIEPGQLLAKAVVARLVGQNAMKSQTGVSGFQAVSLEDRWILSRFNRVAADVNDALATYRFHEAANRIYDFFWGEFCDWYLELIKPRLASNVGVEAKQACTMLVMVFEGALRLLHPIMPFISEEIWQTMHESAPPFKSIALAPFPASDKSQIDLPAETHMAILQDLIASIRNIRAELKIDTKTHIPVEIFAHDPETGISIMQNDEAIRRLANVSSITSVEEWKARQSPSRSTARFDVHVIYERKIDVTAECERLKKELERIEKGISNGQRQLGNEAFLAKAPVSVVENLRKTQQELAVLREKTVSKMAELSCT